MAALKSHWRRMFQDQISTSQRQQTIQEKPESCDNLNELRLIKCKQPPS